MKLLLLTIVLNMVFKLSQKYFSNIKTAAITRLFLHPCPFFVLVCGNSSIDELLPIKDSYEEKSLLLQVSTGNQHAFRQLFDLHRDLVYARALHFLKSPSLAEDILQETFLRIWQHHSKLAEVKNFGAYLTTISRNLIFSYFRKMANHSMLLERLGEILPEETEASAPIALENKELQEVFHSMMALLTKQQQKIFRLSRIEGLSHAEIAKELGLQRETVKKHITDALHTIRLNLSRFPALAQMAVLLYLYTP